MEEEEEKEKTILYHPKHANSVISIIKRNPEYETFYALASNTYDDKGHSWAEIMDNMHTGFTVFAPTNAALQNVLEQLQSGRELKVGDLNEMINDSQSKHKLSQLVAYHIVVSIYSPKSFEDGKNLRTYAGNMLLPVKVKRDKISILGTPIIYLPIGDYPTHIGENYEPVNGFVYRIDKVFIPFETDKRIMGLEEKKNNSTQCYIL